MTVTGTDLSHVDLTPLGDAYAGRITYPPGARFGPRRQTHVQWFAVERGRVELHVDRSSVVVAPGHGVLLWPGASERFDFDPARSTTHVWCSWHWGAATRERARRRWLEVGGENATGPVAWRYGGGSDRLMALTLDLPSRTRAEDPWLTHQRERLIEALALSLLVGRERLRDATVPPSVATFVDLVSAHYGEPWTLRRLATQVGVTPEHLVRATKRATGETPMALLWRIRAERGADLLRGSDLPVHVVAERVGCANQAHFSRLIRTRFGRPPTRLRAEARGRFVAEADAGRDRVDGGHASANSRQPP